MKEDLYPDFARHSFFDDVVKRALLLGLISCVMALAFSSRKSAHPRGQMNE